MGAEQFETRRPETDVAEAFREAVDDARYMHGHAGYTGTIAEKSEYVVWETGMPADLAVRYLQTIRPAYGNTSPAGVPDEIFRAYDDKWGPAVAIRDGETGGWMFCGWASS
jgi:hypothetical protein